MLLEHNHLLHTNFSIILVMKTEMAHSASKEAVEKFDKNNMKHVETQEKNPLPDGEGNL